MAMSLQTPTVTRPLQRKLYRKAKERKLHRGRLWRDFFSVRLAMKPVGEPDAGDRHVRLCVQQRLVCSAGDRPAGAGVGSPVVWMAGWRETKILKPIDKISLEALAALFALLDLVLKDQAHAFGSACHAATSDRFHAGICGASFSRSAGPASFPKRPRLARSCCRSASSIGGHRLPSDACVAPDRCGGQKMFLRRRLLSSGFASRRLKRQETAL